MFGFDNGSLMRCIQLTGSAKLTVCPARKKEFSVDSARECSLGCKDAVYCSYCDVHIFVHREEK